MLEVHQPVRDLASLPGRWLCWAYLQASPKYQALCIWLAHSQTGLDALRCGNQNIFQNRAKCEPQLQKRTKSFRHSLSVMTSILEKLMLVKIPDHSIFDLLTCTLLPDFMSRAWVLQPVWWHLQRCCRVGSEMGCGALQFGMGGTVRWPHQW